MYVYSIVYIVCMYVYKKKPLRLNRLQLIWNALMHFLDFSINKPRCGQRPQNVQFLFS